jgi:hypothetical protein
MRNRAFSFLFLISLTIAATYPLGAEVMNKIQGYKRIQDFSRALWFDSSDPKVADYEIEVAAVHQMMKFVEQRI